ncbi:MAG: hypothetical protein IT204_13945 [Fimbriimonadaceae bacterium]|nr:hypothetical protein [Fimbriimonadaceae bacterium]
MPGGRGALALVALVLSVLLAVGQQLFRWLPEQSGSTPLGAVVGGCLVVALLFLAVTGGSADGRRLRQVKVHCTACGAVLLRSDWAARGCCPRCHHTHFELLPQAAGGPPVPLGGSPTPTPLATPQPAAAAPRRPGRLVDDSQVRLPRGARRRVNARIDEVLVARRRVTRI